MSKYTPDSVHLTKKHLMEIIAGKGKNCVHLKHHHLHGPHRVFLTKSQHARLGKARDGGKKAGFILKLSNAQIKHHLKHGGGIWDSIKNAAKKVYEAAKPLVREHAHKAVNALAEHARPRVDAAIGKLAALAGEHIGHGNAASVAKFLTGHAHKAVSKAKHKAHNTLKEHGLGLTSAGGRGISNEYGGRVKRKYTRRAKGGAVAGILKPYPVRQGAS